MTAASHDRPPAIHDVLARVRTLSACTVGAGATALCPPRRTRHRIGTVVGTFSRGWYVRCGNDLVAIGSIPAGPIHMQVEPTVAGSTWSDLDGTSVTTGPGGIWLGPVSIDMTSVVEWSPSLPTHDELVMLAQRMTVVAADRLIDKDLEDVWPDLRRMAGRQGGLAATDLELIVERLAGRGSGLTPSGDDVIAGILLVDAWRRPSDDARAHRLNVVATARTSDLSRAFLRWAALGQCIEPVHRLVIAASAGTMADFALAVNTVARIGGSSGRGLLAGLACGFADVH